MLYQTGQIPPVWAYNPNYYSGTVSADAAGVIATLFALGQLAAEVTDVDECGPLIDHYHQLLEFADSHAEGGAIFQAID